MTIIVEPQRQVPAWQVELAQAYRRPADLLAALDLPPDLPVRSGASGGHFPLRVPRGFVSRMQKGNARDPLFLQVWPQPEEQQAQAGFTVDAVGDLTQRKAGGLIHKYHGRALVVATGACAIHCRYCFRQHFPYAESQASRSQWQGLLDTLAADTSLEEIILSGGDPLSLTDDKLAALVQGLDAIPHLKRLRIHTRQPVVLPERVDPALLCWLSATRLKPVMVLHINHEQEIDAAVADAVTRLRAAGVMLFNQSVLLRGVNDSVAALQALSERLFDHGIVPYYLHQLDRVQGAAHHEVPEPAAKVLMQGLSASMPGYLVPRLVRETQGEPAKTWIHW
jgi:L-lysine 2,3-aminomutase